jgi:hypothetical protein
VEWILKSNINGKFGDEPLWAEVYFGHHNLKLKMMKILEVYQSPSTLVPVLVKLLRQAFNWHSDEGVWGKCFIFGIFLKMPCI